MTNLIHHEASLSDAIAALNEYEIKMLVVCKHEKVIGTISDGDIRRHIAKHGLLDSVVTQIMNSQPYMINDDDTKNLAEKIRQAQQAKISNLVIIDALGNYKEILELSGTHPMLLDNTCVLMAGGMGTRLRPATLNTPKPMLLIQEKPILEHQILMLKSFGIKNFYISVNYLKEKIIDYFGDGSKLSVNISYIHENKRMGTAGALSLLPETERDPIIVMNGDVISQINLYQMVKDHAESSADLTIAAKSVSHTVPFGVISVDAKRVTEIVEKPTYSYLCSAGIYVVNRSAIETIPQNTYHDITETIDTVIQSGGNVNVFPLIESWHDIGTPEDLALVQDGAFEK